MTLLRKINHKRDFKCGKHKIDLVRLKDGTAHGKLLTPLIGRSRDRRAGVPTSREQ